MFFQAIKNIFITGFRNDYLPGWRKFVQVLFALFCIYSGYRFYLFFQWAIGASNIYVPRPPSVEAFLPISALMSLKLFIFTGRYDVVHPAGLTIFLAALVIAFLLRKGFCGWICPVGFISNLVNQISRKLKLEFRAPLFINFPLLTLKYFLLAFFCYIILWKMNVNSIESFIKAPYNLVVDAKMLLFFLDPTRTTIWVLLFILLFSIIFRNFWCRFLCPYGALLGLLSLGSPVIVKREKKNCVDCKKCDKICPGSIIVSRKTDVRTAECIGCLECVAVCPKENCLTLAIPGIKKNNPYVLPVLVVSVFLFFWVVANQTGHWQSMIPPESLKKLYMYVLNLRHP